MQSYFLIFGFGYTAKILADKLIANDIKVVGTSSTFDKKEAKNSNIILVDFNSKNIERYLSLATHILICIPPISNLGDIVLNQYSSLIRKYASNLQWLSYLSSTSVYGNYEGAWVNEKSPCIPHTPTGIARLQAENAWLNFSQRYQLPLHIFRLAGIYGPNRNILERLLLGKKNSIFKENQFFCRIHVDDIANTLLTSIKSPKPLSIYNVCDDEPAPSHIVDLYATRLLNRDPLPLIPIAKANLSTMEQEFYANNRRVSNLKIKEELQVSLLYPTYKEGLYKIYKKLCKY